MRTLLRLLSLSVLASISSTQADDIEIYTGSSGSVRSNVVMIMDTSGSMSIWATEAEEVSPDPYDPNTVYSDGVYGFNPNALYMFRLSGTLELSNSLASLIKEYEINRASVLCDSALTAVDSTGSYTGKLQFWRSGSWYDSSAGWTAPYMSLTSYLFGLFRPTVDTNASHIVECEQSGNYDYNGGGYKYLKNSSSSPYTNSYYSQKNWVLDYYTVVWSGNYLNYLASPSASISAKTRLDVAREAAIDVVKGTSGVNISLMRFSSNSDGGFVDIPLSPVEDLTTSFEDAINLYDPAGGTPMEESLYEAYRYLNGDTVTYGKDSQSIDITNIKKRDNDGFISDYDGSTISTPSVAASRNTSNSNKYKLASALECTPTKIILFSDGEPSNDKGANDAISKLVKNISFESGLSGLSTNCSGDGACAEELAYYMYRNDHRPTDIDGKQIISVDTFGGFLTNDSARNKLKNIAAAGGGNYYEGDDYASIREGLTQAITTTITNPSTFTSPTVAVNSFNSLESSDELYFAVFEPNNKPAWKGNLKRYRMGDGAILDKLDTAAVDTETGFFKEDTISVWSTEADGPNVDLGGASSNFNLPRTVFTSVNVAADGTLNKLEAALPAASNIGVLNSSIGLVNSATKSLLTQDLLGITDESSDYQDQLIAWMLGINSDSSTRTTMEDPLHSRPVVINYGKGDSTLFIASNSGYLHAIDTNANNTSNITNVVSNERFAFIPKELLKNPYAYFDSTLSSLELKRYGLDGAITHWHEDINYDGIVNGDDRVILYVGMRRGGQSYYALDITNRDAPKLLWQLNGNYIDTTNVNAPSLTSGFDLLGQTWSALTVAEVKWNGRRKIVLFAGGGYDPDQDGADVAGPGARIPDDVGNTIYMIDASTGAVLWNANTNLGLSTSMTNSFAADVIPIDRDGNGYSDLLYATDVGGRVWRFDFSETATSGSNFATGGIIADINGGTEQTNRRFYSAPDVSYQTVGGKSFILLSIGSGYRAHPLNNSVTDYHFLIKDIIGKSYPTSYNAISFNNLVEWGANNAASSDYGWYVPLEDVGEKALSRSLTFNGQVLFTTYSPNDPDLEVFCGGDTGVARLYSLKIESPETKETVVELKQGGIPSEPVIPTNPGVMPITIIGAEVVTDILPATPFTPASSDYWREK